MSARKKTPSAFISLDVSQQPAYHIASDTRQPRCLQKRTSTCWLPTRRVCTLPMRSRSRVDCYWSSSFFFFPPCTPASKTGVCIPHHAYLRKVIPTPAPHFLAISKLQTPKCRSILSSGNDYKMLSPFLLQIDRALAHLDSFSKMPQHSYSSKQTLVCPTGTCIAVTHWPFQRGKPSHSAAG